MSHFGWTIEDIQKLDLVQIGVLIECIRQDIKEQERAIRRASRRR